MGNSCRSTVLIVEDEPAVADSFEILLGDDYEILKATTGSEALERVSHDIDVVLLDRMMPGMSGDEVLEKIRNRNIQCRVAMVTAVEPDFDIIEMGFDDYITKPPTKQGLRETVEDLLSRSDYTQSVQKYHSLLSKPAALQIEKNSDELEESDAYAELEAELERLDEKLDESNDRLLDDAEFIGALRDLTGDEEPEGGP